MTWILNLIGMLIFFINRYYGREKKTIKFSLKFWFKDNFQEFSTTILFNLAAMIILHMKNVPVDSAIAQMPDWIKVFGLPGLCFFLGLGLAWTAYKLFASKLATLK